MNDCHCDNRVLRKQMTSMPWIKMASVARNQSCRCTGTGSGAQETLHPHQARLRALHIYVCIHPTVGPLLKTSTLHRVDRHSANCNRADEVPRWLVRHRSAPAYDMLHVAPLQRPQPPELQFDRLWRHTPTFGNTAKFNNPAVRFAATDDEIGLGPAFPATQEAPPPRNRHEHVAYRRRLAVPYKDKRQKGRCYRGGNVIVQAQGHMHCTPTRVASTAPRSRPA